MAGAAPNRAASGRPAMARLLSEASAMSELSAIARLNARAQVIVQASLLRMWATSCARMPPISPQVMRRNKPSVSTMAPWSALPNA